MCDTFGCVQSNRRKGKMITERRNAEDNQLQNQPASSLAVPGIDEHGTQASMPSSAGPSRTMTPAAPENDSGVELPDPNSHQVPHDEERRDIVSPREDQAYTEVAQTIHKQEQVGAENDGIPENPALAPSANHEKRRHGTVVTEIEAASNVPNSSNELEAPRETRQEDQPEDQPGTPPDTIFRVRTIEAGKPDRYFYSDRAFDGLKDSLDEDEEKIKTLFDVCIDVEGKSTAEMCKESMKRSEWWMAKKRINFGSDFNIQVQRSHLLIIRDPGIRWAFRTLVKYDPDRRVRGKSIPVHWPFPLIMWYHNNLKDLQKELLEEAEANRQRSCLKSLNLTPQQVANGIDCLLKFVAPLYDATIEPEINFQELRADLPSQDAAATFEHLWLLFKPGEMAYVKVDGDYSAVIIIEAKEVKENTAFRTRDSGRHFRVSVWNYRLVNGLMVRHRSIIRIEEFQDQRQISLLPVFPCRYPNDNKNLRDRLKHRGQKYFDFVKQDYAHMQYNGKTLDKQPREYNGHIVLDASAYLTYLYHRPQLQPIDKRLHEILGGRIFQDRQEDIANDPLTPSAVIEPEDSGGGEQWQMLHEFDPRTVDEKELTPDHYMLFPRRIMGMTIKDKQWVKFDVNLVEPIVWPKENALKDLVLPRESLNFLKAACPEPSSKRDTEEWSADYVQGKGAGQVFLLHGPPGTGKTFTVECMAIHNKQVLLSLTVGDLGTNEVQAEYQLSKWFNLARKWKAILLVDEADVFMETRMVKDLHRNSLVSVFLRTMEYYEGTLFLTTNRIGQLDPAISSRVQVAIYYPPFGINNEGSRSTSRIDQVKIWEHLFERLEKSRSEVFVSTNTRESILDSRNVIGPELNAREIRNAFNLAVQLSEYGAVNRHDKKPQNFELRFNDLERAVKMRERFKKQCNEAAGANSEQERAEMMHDRGPHTSDDY